MLLHCNNLFLPSLHLKHLCRKFLLFSLYCHVGKWHWIMMVHGIRLEWIKERNGTSGCSCKNSSYQHSKVSSSAIVSNSGSQMLSCALEVNPRCGAASAWYNLSCKSMYMLELSFFENKLNQLAVIIQLMFRMNAYFMPCVMCYFRFYTSLITFNWSI